MEWWQGLTSCAVHVFLIGYGAVADFELDPNPAKSAWNQTTPLFM
jgi:hypothetical protein